MAHSGLLSWANSVRLTMASDPGRQAFSDQVQTLGFLFLDDYLDNILSGAKQDPLIELVKTPGRKKIIAKTKPGPSKLSKSTVADDEENITPVNDFQKTLLSTKAADRERPAKSGERGDVKETPQRPALRPVQALVHNAGSALDLTGIFLQPPSLESTAVATELSIIAEDEEPSERTHPSTSTCEQETLASVSYMDMDTNTFHLIPLSSLTQNDSRMQTASPSLVVDTDDGRIHEHQMTNDRKEYPMDQPQEDNTTFSKAVDKTLFPILPEPMPLRKSTRLRDTSINAVLGAATPGAGKRTSWLAKAREVKALEGNGKKPNPCVMPSLSALNPIIGYSDAVQGTKRKSEMLFGHNSASQEERVPKIAKLVEGEIGPRKSKEKTFLSSSYTQGTLEQPKDIQQHETQDPNPEEGVLDLLRRTVQGLGVRASKTMGKSLGGDAATALAEAKAAAEARLAERDRREETALAVGQAVPMTLTVIHDEVDVPMPLSVPKKAHEDRISLSELFPRDGRVKEKHKVPEKVFHKTTLPPPAVTVKDNEAARLSTSTTPPNTPPSTHSGHAVAPVFTKPVPVFVPPIPVASKLTPISKETSVLPLHNIPSSMVVGFGTRLPSPNGRPLAVPLTAQSSIESVHSETLFEDDNTPAWIPSTQDTEYTPGIESQSQPQVQVCDEDDSWPVDDKLAAGVQWTYGGSKEDSMTWSTLPSDTGRFTKTSLIEEHVASNLYDIDGRKVEVDREENLIARDQELEEIVLGSKSTVSLVKQPELTRSQSQLSIAASESSQSQAGFFGQASKFLSSALGTSKKKPEVKKVLQMAAVAAKKQQEEADKKAVRLKEMEMRRQQAIQRKAEEEKAKVLEEERKMKGEAERRRREKEEANKQPFKPTMSKREDDTKKRKVDPSPMDKKSDLKKPAPSVLLGKSHLKYAAKQAGPSSTGHVNSTQATASPLALLESANHTTIATPYQKKKTQAPQRPAVEDFTQPSQMVQSQMAARAKAQIEASKPTVPSESIELPDINSEYSDSEDEDRPRTYDPPDWAQSPELRQALEQQSTINPDDIFGAVRPLKMEEIFKTKTSRFRARTSSANWTGSDRLTIQEELEYARRMGFK